MKMKLLTIEELVDLFHPDYVGVNNPAERGKKTPAETKVRSFQVDYDDADGVLLYVTIERTENETADNGISNTCIECINRTHLSCETIRKNSCCRRGLP